MLEMNSYREKQQIYKKFNFYLVKIKEKMKYLEF